MTKAFDPKAYAAKPVPKPEEPSLDQMPGTGGTGMEGVPLSVAPEEAPPSPDTPQLPADPGLARSMLAAFGQGGLKGASDEAAGVLGSALVGEGTGEPGTQYRGFRNAEREVLRGGQEHHPYASFVADLAGDIGSDWLLSQAGIPVTSTGYQAAAGGLSGLMRSESELSGRQTGAEDLAAAGGSAALGAGLGALVPKLGERVARHVLPPLAARGRQALEALAKSQANRVLLNGARSLANRLPLSDEALLQSLADRAVSYFGTVGGAAKRLEGLAEQRGSMYGAILQRLEALGVRGPQAEPLARSLAEEAGRISQNTGADKAVAEVFQREADNIRALARPPPNISMAASEAGGRGAAELGLGQAENIKRALQRAAKYGRYEDTPLNEARQEAASRVRQAIEDTVEEAGLSAPAGSELSEVASEFVPIKRLLGNTLEAERAAIAGASKGANRSAVSLPAWMMASGAGGGPVGQAATAIGTDLLRNRGASTVASGAYDLSRAARALTNPRTAAQVGGEVTAALTRENAYVNPRTRSSVVAQVLEDPARLQAMGKYGEQLARAAARGDDALAVEHFVLSQTDPEYQRLLREQQGATTP